MNSAHFAVLSRRVVTPAGERDAAVIVENGKISRIVPRDALDKQISVYDCAGLALLPGVVDTHVHVNEPGRTDWEGYETATLAAATGGATTLVDMPLNCIPVTTSVAALEAKLAALQKKLSVDCGFYGGFVPGNEGDLLPMARRGVLGFKSFLVHSGIDDFPNVLPADLDRGMPEIARAGLPLLVHAELELPGAPPVTGATYASYLNSRPKEWENAAVRLVIDKSRATGCRVHVVHLSSAEAVPLLRAARKSGVRVSAETCPHYLTFTAEAVQDGDTRFKCSPPIRDKRNQDDLWASLARHDIDFVVSDHSPCAPHLKHLERGDFDKAWGGISGLQFGLVSVWTGASARGAALGDLARWMSEAPAALVGLTGRKGAIAPGYDADLVVFDPDKKGMVRADAIRHRHKVTPYEGLPTLGSVEATFLRGQLIYERGAIKMSGAGAPLCGAFMHKPLPDDAPAFARLLNLAAGKLGGLPIHANDEFFAEKENLVQAHAPVFIDGKFTDRGKWMDGWESRRKRVPGHDWCVLRLGLPGEIAGFDIDTSFFVGNFPPFASVDALMTNERLTVHSAFDALAWRQILAKSPLKPGASNFFAAIRPVAEGVRYSHVRLNIFPDGGVARFKVFGRALPDWTRVRPGEVVDLAAVDNGGTVEACNDMFFGEKDSLIMPGRGVNMGDGWETRRKRDLPGHDWCVVRLGAAGVIQRVVIDTNNFKGNHPDRASLEACNAPGAGPGVVPAAGWVPLLAETPLGGHRAHEFAAELCAKGPFTHVRLNIVPDGGVARLRVWGTVAG